MTLITKDGEYQTRSGLPVRIYATDGGTTHDVVHGAYSIDGVWMHNSWGKNGRIYEGDCTHGLDLIPVPKVRKLDYWVNVYHDGHHEPHQTRCDADEFAKMLIRTRIACIHIEREVKEGEGLE